MKNSHENQGQENSAESPAELLPFSDRGIDRLIEFFDVVDTYRGGIGIYPPLLMLSSRHKAQLLSDCIAAARRHVENCKAIERIVQS